MKKIILLLLSIGMCFAFASCFGATNSEQSGDVNSNGTESTGGEIEDDSSDIVEDVTVTFKQDGKADVVKTVNKGDDLTDVPVPAEKTGYSVVWDRTDFTDIMENITVNAVETAKSYTITYDANGGTVANATQSVVYDAEYTLETPIHAESYMSFDCWKDLAGNTIAVAGTWTTDRDMALTAQWTDTRASYTISFVQEGQETKVFTVKEGESFTEIPTPAAKTGYTVAWDKTEFTNITEDVTVTVVETAKTYTIILNANGGNASQKKFTVTYGQAYEFVKPTHNEKSFVSWTYNGEKVSLSGVWNIDIEDGEGELVAEWGGSIWSKNY